MFTPEQDHGHLQLALAQARKSMAESGIPIGAALVHASGRILSTGHNCRVQRASNVLHAEMDCIERYGRPDAGKGGVKVLRECTMYTTYVVYRGISTLSSHSLSPCIMCSATCVLYGIPRVVLGENETFLGGEDLLRAKGVKVVNLQSTECRTMMKTWVEGAGREIWWEDIGLDPSEAQGGASRAT